MRLKKRSNDAEFDLVWPKILPTKEQMQENDMTGIFITMTSDSGDIHSLIYAPFSENFDYEVINEEGDKPWTMQQ